MMKLILCRCFNQSSVEDILAALEREGSEWATNHLQVSNHILNAVPGGGEVKVTVH